MKKLIIAALLFVPMSAYAFGIPDPFEASNTAQDAYQWPQQAIGDSAAANGLAQKDSLAEQVLQTTVNTDFTNAKDYTNQAVNGIIGEANSNAAVSIKAADSEQDAEANKSLAQAQTDANGALSSALSSSAKGDKVTLASANQTSASGDASTLVSANQAAATGDKTTLASANTDAQVMANAAQSSSESYTPPSPTSRPMQTLRATRSRRRTTRRTSPKARPIKPRSTRNSMLLRVSQRLWRCHLHRSCR